MMGWAGSSTGIRYRRKEKLVQYIAKEERYSIDVVIVEGIIVLL